MGFWVSSMPSDIEKTNSLNYSLFRLRDNILMNLDHSDVFLDSDISTLKKQTPPKLVYLIRYISMTTNNISNKSILKSPF